MQHRILSQHVKLVLFAVMSAVGMLLIFRSMGLRPTVFSDEYFHSVAARCVPFNQAFYPNYLYYLIYSVTNYCGEGFLEGARLMNVLFFVSAAPFIYLVSQKVTTPTVALLIAALSILGPINSYTAYFMPESTYFFFFWAFTWAMLNTSVQHGVARWCCVGSLFGLTTLIKPHALFLLPSLATFFLLHHRHGSPVPPTRKKEFALYSVFILSALGTKFGLGYLFAGKTGLSFFGTSYSAQAPGLDYYIKLIGPFFENGQGHLLSLAVLFSVPAAQLILSLSNVFKREGVPHAFGNVALYTVMVFAFLIPVVALYTASRAVMWPEAESNYRLHLRYYNFAFPLFLVVAASQVSLTDTSESRRWRVVIGVPLGIAILYALYTRISPFSPSHVDGPEMYGLLRNAAAFYCLAAASFVALALWIYGRRAGAVFFLYVFAPFSVVCSTFYTNDALRQSMVTHPFDRPGLSVRRYLADANVDLSKVHIACADHHAMFRAGFYLEDATLEFIAPGSVYNLAHVHPSKDWLLLVGEHQPLGGGCIHLQRDGYVLMNLQLARGISFANNSDFAAVARHSGLSDAEPWGRWSSSDSVKLEFGGHLPERFRLHLCASAFGPNVGKDFVAHVGETTVNFRLGAIPEETVLEFTNSSRAGTITIDIPSPTSPRELGQSEDLRRLGIGLLNMRVAPIPAAEIPGPAILSGEPKSVQ